MINRLWKNGIKCLCLLISAAFVYSSSAQAKVCFLPGGKCPGDASPSSVIRAVQGDQCLGYNLTQIKCKDLACEIGWDCESCTNAQGTFYKCTKKPTPPGYTPGLEKCPSPCQKYTWSGFTGTQINGKCEDIADYTATKPNPCRTYITPDYTCGASIAGAEVNDLTKENGGCTVCYTNIVQMNGYTTSKPASCKTYNSRRNGLGSDSDTMCYTAGISIGDHFSTTERDSTVFIIETQYGSDTFIALNGSQSKKNTEACYRATGCNASNGWLPAKDVDGNKFEFTERSSDGITCRKAVACKESNNWFNYDKLGQYKDKHFMTTEETRSGLTCYNATGCHSKAYSAEPDARYFKFDKKTSNNYNCWTVTGKADYAYDANEKQPKYFDYDSGKEAYLNGTSTVVHYYLVDKCMQYAYSSQPDATYFSFNSVTQKKGGANTDITCWNVTDKGANAYYAGERKLTYFDYDDATAYINGTATTGTYYRAKQCMKYAYTSQPDAKYFSFNSETQKKSGTTAEITCWNITGKGTYAYAESEKNTKFFAYDGGKEGYLNGTATTGKYFDITSCGTYAYPGKPDETFFAVASQTKKKGGVDTDITCWNTTGCGTYAYVSQPDARFFTSDSKVNKKNGADDNLTCWRATGKATYAYDSQPDGTFFASSSQTAYKNGTPEQMTFWIVDGCGTYAYTSADRPTYFTYDNSTMRKNGSSTNVICYRATGLANGAYASSPDANIFAVNEEKAYKLGTSEVISSWRATGCNASRHYSTTKPDANYFTSTNSAASGITCHVATGCITKGDITSSKPGDCRIYSTQTNGAVACYYNIGWVGGDTTATTNNPGDCRTYKTGNDTNGKLCYYNVACVESSCSATTNKPSTSDYDCHTFSSATGSNGKACYWNVSGKLTREADSETQNCTLTQSCQCSQSCSTSCTESASCSESTSCSDSDSKTESTSCSDSDSKTESTDCSCGSESCGCGGTKTCSGTKSRSCSRSYSGTKSRSCTRSLSGTKSRSGTKYYSGTKYGTQYRDGTQSLTGSQSRTRSITCNSNGTGYSVGGWSGWGTCTSSNGWGSCSCSGGWGTCGNYGNCTGGSWGSCSWNGWSSCSGSWSGWSCGNYGDCSGSWGSWSCDGYGSCSGSYGSCSKSDCPSGQTCSNGSCVTPSTPATCSDAMRQGYQKQCNSWGGTLDSSPTEIVEDECHAVFDWCGNEFYYCLASIPECN